MKKFINKYSAFALLMLGVIAGGLTLWSLRSKPAPAPPPLPNPNGYDDFLKAAQFEVDVPPEVRDGDLAKLAEAVEQNKETLRLVRLGLSRECRVPVQFTKAYELAHIADLGPLRLLARVLTAEGKLAERQGRYVDALASYLDCFRLGSEAARGGLLLDKLSAGTFDGFGLEGLRRIHNRVPLTQMRQAIKTLREIDAQREPTEDILQRDAEWDSQVYDWWANLSARLENHHTILPSTVDQYWQSSLGGREAKFRLGIMDLAIKHHRLQTGRLPARLRDLVPGSISQLPADPFNSGGFIYRTNATGYLLYSIGPNGKDDGGAALVVPSGKGTPKGDILPESP